MRQRVGEVLFPISVTIRQRLITDDGGQNTTTRSPRRGSVRGWPSQNLLSFTFWRRGRGTAR